MKKELLKVNDDESYMRSMLFQMEFKNSQVDDDLKSDFMEQTISTRNRTSDKWDQAHRKLSSLSTFLSLLKSNLGTNFLFVPRGFVNGGWMLTSCAMLFSCVLSMKTSIMLLEVNQKTGYTTFSEMGYKLYGRLGQFFSELSLVISQFSFCCSILYFLKENVCQIILEAFGVQL